LKTSLDISIIGKSGHAERIINILKQQGDVQIRFVLYPKEAQKFQYPLTTKISDLLSSDAIIIASPTPTHKHYLDSLKDYQGYIMVEKPIVSTYEDSCELESWSKDRKSKILVNYNLKNSSLAQVLSDVIGMTEMGSLISMDVQTHQGLAFRDHYSGSWRSNIQESFGVMELVGVHYVNLCLKLFQDVTCSYIDVGWHAGQSSQKPPDTVFMRLKTSSGVKINLCHSYAAPFFNRIMLMGTNGYWTYDGYEARLFSPRDSFDESGRFSPLPLIQSSKIEYQSMWKQSLETSIKIFLNSVRNQEKFDIEDFHTALASMKPIFEARDSLKT